MAKKKKKGGGKKKVSAPRQQDFQELIQEQKAALSAGRGRRASVLGERIFQDVLVDEAMRRKSFAVGHEAHLREMLSKGHRDQVRAKACKLLGKEGWLADSWALSLQLYLGLAEYREDRDWLARLRAELVDPADLCEIEQGGLGEQAQLVLDAWTLVEKGRGAEALERLQGIGRRSPLVDWRLFVQALVAVAQNDRDGADSAVRHMLPNCPARATAETLLANADGSVGFYARRLKGLEKPGGLKPSEYPRLAGLVKHALAEGRAGLAVTLAASFGSLIENQFYLDRYFTLFERMQTKGFSLKHIYIRIAVMDFPHDAFLRTEMMEDLRDPGWSRQEMTRLWIRFFEQIRRRWNELRGHLMGWELQKAREGFLFGLLDDCEWLVRRLPDFREAYLFWIWVERECEDGALGGLNAYLDAFPEDPDVLKMAVDHFAEVGAFKEAEGALTRLRRMAESEETIAALRQGILFYRIEDAYEEGRGKVVERLASGFRGRNLSERIRVAFMCWRMASKGNKRKRGAELAEFGLPWLVLFYACRYEERFTVSKFPAALKRALENDPDSVLQSYLELLKCEAESLKGMELEVLYATLGKALDHPAVSIALLRSVLSALLLNGADPDEWVYATGGTMGAFRTLLAGGADDQALAVALRVQMLFAWGGWPLDEDKTERSLRVAWTLAGHDETRSLVARVNSRTKAVTRSVLKKPATQKMVKAELKMQRKFEHISQVRDRYVSIRQSPAGFDPFGGVDIEAAVERLLDRYDLDDFPDESGEACTESYPPWEDAVQEPPPEYVPEPVSRTKSKPYVFSKFIPTMEMEFERMIEEIREETKGKHRKTAVATLGEMIDGSSLSEQAKARLRAKQGMLQEGE